MEPGSNDRAGLLGVESVEDVANGGYPRQPNAPPPPYQSAADLSSPNLGFTGQSSVGNYHIPVPNQLPSMIYYGNPHIQPTIGQLTLPGGVSTLPTSQPVYLIPASALTNRQPLNYSQYGAIQSRIVRTQPINMRAPEPNTYACIQCCCCVFVLLTAAFIVVLLLIASKRSKQFSGHYN